MDTARLRAAFSLVSALAISGLALAGCSSGPSGPPFAYDAQVRSVLTLTAVTNANQCPTSPRTQPATQVISACSRDHKVLYRLAPATATGGQIISYGAGVIDCSVKRTPCPDPDFRPYVVGLQFNAQADSAISNEAYRVFHAKVDLSKPTYVSGQYVLVVRGQVESVGVFGQADARSLRFATRSAEDAFLYRLTNCHRPVEVTVGGEVTRHCED
jgi:hypothetical protein